MRANLEIGPGAAPDRLRADSSRWLAQLTTTIMAMGTATAAIPMITAKVIKTFSTGTSLSSLADRAGAECLLSVAVGLPFDPMFLLS